MLKTWTAKQKLQKAFKLGDIGINYSYGNTSGKIYPKIQRVTFTDDTLKYVFTLPVGMDPKLIIKHEYCFRQVFGQNIEIKGDVKTFALTVFTASLPSEITYEYEQYQEQLTAFKLPILCGVDRFGTNVLYDMVQYPHLLIAGETGSGKSTQLRSILSTLIQNVPPDRLQLFLCDMKRSEFHVFRRVESVQCVLTTPSEMAPMLLHLQDECRKRGDLLDHYEVAHIDEVDDKLPYIVLCIDEVALLKKEKDLMEIVEEISAIGRALGVFLILSMQRPDSQILDGKLKNCLTVRMGFKCADLINSRIIGTPGSEKLKSNGKMLLKLDGMDSIKEIQAPYLSIERCKKILEGYKSRITKKPLKSKYEPSDDIIEGIFEVLDDEET